MNIVEFLEARITEDEAMARAASTDGGSWDTISGIGGSTGSIHAGGELFIDEDGDASYYGGSVIVYDEGTPDRAQAEHIARHDPARVLAECKAKREIVELHQPTLSTVEWFDDATGTGHAPICPSCRPEDPTDWHPPIGMAGIRPEGFVPHYTLAPCPTLCALAAMYAANPDYRREWAERHAGA